MDRAGLACFGLVGNADQQGSCGSPHKSYGEFFKKVLNSACLIIKALFQATSFFPPQLEKDTLELFLKRKLQYSIEMWSSPSKYSCVYP